MPEAPEVQTVLNTLAPKLDGAVIKCVTIHHPKLAANLPVEQFEKDLAGQTITGFDRHGKYLVLETTDYDWVIHLRMEGKFYLLDGKPEKEKHMHAFFELEDGRCLVYQDTRKFGRMYLFPKVEDIAKLPVLEKAGPDLLKGPDEAQRKAIHKKFSRKAPVKAVLLDQTVMAGIGNIYADEILFKTRIHSRTPAKNLSPAQIDAIIDTAHKILVTAAENKGTTIRSYTSSLGVQGEYQDALQVHMKEGEPCPVCGTPIEKLQVAQRGTYCCPSCQKEN